MNVRTQRLLCSCSLGVLVAGTHAGTKSQRRDLCNCASHGGLVSHEAITDARDALIQRKLHSSGGVDLRAKQSEIGAGNAGCNPRARGSS